MGLISIIISGIIYFLIMGVSERCKQLSNSFPVTISGYKTKISVINEDTWKEANTYFAKRLYGLGNIYMIINIFVGIKFFSYHSTILIINSLLIITLLCLSIAMTEIHIKRKFNNDGTLK